MPDQSSRTFLQQAASSYNLALKQDDRAESAREYLRSRGLLPDNSPSGLGYVADPLPGHEQYAGRIAIPYWTRAGFTTIRFRCAAGHDCKAASCAKYLSPPGDCPRLYNVRRLYTNAPVIAICEGEFDTLTADHAGLPAVGVAGVQAWEPFFSRAFKGYETVFVLADNDDKGQGLKFGNEVARSISNARVALMPEGHDVNSFVMAEGPQALMERLELSDA